MVKLPEEVKDLLVPSGEVLKVIGTADSNGIPHTIILGTLIAIDDETLAFATLSTKTTVNNLKTTKKASIAVYKPPMTAYRIEGTYHSSQTSGPLFDKFSKELEKIKMTCHSVELIKVDGVYYLGTPEPGKRIV